MKHILAWTEPDDHTGTCTGTAASTPTTDGTRPSDGAASLGVVLEGDELMEALARASGRYGLYANGSTMPEIQPDGAGGAGGSGGAPPDDRTGNDDNGDHGHGRSSFGPPRCEHGEILLSTGDIVPEFGGPEIDEVVWWCPLRCSRTDHDGRPVDPTEWVHRTVPEHFTVTSVTSADTDHPDGVPGTIAVRAEKHPSRQARLVLDLTELTEEADAADMAGMAASDRAYTMTLTAGRQLHRLLTDVIADLG